RTGQEVRVMQMTCMSVRRDTEFQCDDAVAFVAFQSAVRKTAQNAYASLRMLRALQCALPVELWYLESEMSAATVASDPILRSMQQELGPLTLHGIAGTRVTGFNSKVHAILRTQLDVVLFLDADNVPARDPTFLFAGAELAQHGAVFWPDFWHPRNTIFNFDPSGRDVLFLHRNAQKLSNDSKATPVWTHLQTFERPQSRLRGFFGLGGDIDWYAAVKKDFDIMIYSSGDDFPEAAMCYGERREDAGRSGRFRTVAWGDLPDPALQGLEARLLQFAQDAVGLR
ncbi:hypothetical protein PybrP1_006448, partial [[Pythium] brassicae (nom. inval.)]